MEERRVQELLKELETYRQELAQDAEASKQFLVGAGIVNNEGELQDNFKHLCIPQEQA